MKISGLEVNRNGVWVLRVDRHTIIAPSIIHGRIELVLCKNTSGEKQWKKLIGALLARLE